MAQPMKSLHTVDPVRALKAKVGDLSKLEVFHNKILVAIYQRPESLDLGGGKKLFLSDQTRKEDEWQGKVSLVMKLGPLAFKDDAHNKFEGQQVAPDEWIASRPSDGWSLKVNGVPCRMLEEVHIQARLNHPDDVY